MRLQISIDKAESCVADSGAPACDDTDFSLDTAGDSPDACYVLARFG